MLWDWKIDCLWDRKTDCFQAYQCIFLPGNCTAGAVEGLKTMLIYKSLFFLNAYVVNF